MNKNAQKWALTLFGAAAGFGAVWFLYKQKSQQPRWLLSWQRFFEKQRGTVEAQRIVEATRGKYTALLNESELPTNPAMRWHIKEHILPGLALYRVLQEENGGNGQAALTDIDGIFRTWTMESVQQQYGKILALPIPFPLFKLAAGLQMKVYPPDGWDISYIENSDTRLAFNITRCFYLDTLTALGAPELTASFCKMDDVMAELFPETVRFVRPHTLGRGDALCDFQYCRGELSMPRARRGGTIMKAESLKGLEDVAETLLIPLCYRAVEARQPEPLICDPRAQEIIDQLGVDPAHLKWRPFQHVFAMLRARQYDRWIQAYLDQHPNCVVVEIGCGLDARFDRLDNGTVRWVDMDLPEVIDLRRRFFADTERRQMLGHSVFNLDWMNCIPPAEHYLYIAEGVFPYFDEDEVRRVFIALAERFPGSEMVVDALSPFMVHASAINPSFRGYQVRPRWGVSDPRSIETWCGGLEVLESYDYFSQHEPRLASVRWMATMAVLRDMARVLRLRLGQNPD